MLSQCLDPQWAATFLSHKQFHAETSALRMCCGKTFGMRAGDGCPGRLSSDTANRLASADSVQLTQFGLVRTRVGMQTFGRSGRAISACWSRLRRRFITCVGVSAAPRCLGNACILPKVPQLPHGKIVSRACNRREWSCGLSAIGGRAWVRLMSREKLAIAKIQPAQRKSRSTQFDE